MTNLGYANGWVTKPDIVVKCDEEHHTTGAHDRDNKPIGRCLTRYWCHTCGYTYLVDSSG